MATITLYASEINQMPGLIKDVKKSVADYKSEIGTLKTKCLSINKSVCDLDDVVSSIQASSQTQEQKIASLDTFSSNVEQFTADAAQIDGDIADLVNQCKDDFYDKYNYLKPDCEKTGWEKFCNGVKSVFEWCREHWKLVVTIFLVVGAVVLIGVCTGGGALAPLLVMIARGILFGAVTGGVFGGSISALTGGSFWEGFESGAFSGAISGAITGGMGGAGKVALTLLKTVLIGAVSEMSASVLGNLGDIIIKGEDISFGELLFDAGLSAVLGGVFAWGGYTLGKIFPKKNISGINSGRGSWAHVWATQSTKTIRYGTKMSIKTILKGIGAKAVEEIWDFVIQPLKDLVNAWTETWMLQPQK